MISIIRAIFDPPIDSLWGQVFGLLCFSLVIVSLFTACWTLLVLSR